MNNFVKENSIKLKFKIIEILGSIFGIVGKLWNKCDIIKATYYFLNLKHKSWKFNKNSFFWFFNENGISASS
jgi:hypothetical protein